MTRAEIAERTSAAARVRIGDLYKVLPALNAAVKQQQGK